MKDLRIFDMDETLLLIVRLNVKGDDHVYTPRFGGIKMNLGRVELKEVKKEDEP